MVTITPINVGQLANDGTGDKARVAFSKTNENFRALQTAIEQLNTDTFTQKTFLKALKANLPTSLDGLSPGDPWLNGDTISFVPNP